MAHPCPPRALPPSCTILHLHTHQSPVMMQGVVKTIRYTDSSGRHLAMIAVEEHSWRALVPFVNSKELPAKKGPTYRKNQTQTSKGTEGRASRSARMKGVAALCACAHAKLSSSNAVP